MLTKDSRVTKILLGWDGRGSAEEAMLKSVLGSVLSTLLGREQKNQFNQPWPYLGEKPVTKKNANKFFLGAIIDYQQKSERIWGEIVPQFAEETMGDSADIWEAITDIPTDEWARRKKEYGLHWDIKAHNRVHRIATELKEDWKSDAREIWKHAEPGVVLERLLKLKVGPAVSRMIVGGLITSKCIEGKGDVKPDVHVRRVLGRVYHDGMMTEKEALEKTRSLHNKNPWQLDNPLWAIGKSFCRASSPKCSQCPLIGECNHWKKSR